MVIAEQHHAADDHLRVDVATCKVCMKGISEKPHAADDHLKMYIATCKVCMKSPMQWMILLKCMLPPVK